MQPDDRPTRRSVIRGGMTAGAALVVAVNLPGTGSLAADVAGDADAFAPDAFIRIGRDGAATLIMPAVEMGQGIYTGIAMILAEELDIPLAGVTLEAAPPNDALYGNPILKLQMTGGSTSIRGWWTPLRKAGASARAMLVQAAARRWRVDPVTCHTENGQVHHDGSGRSASYASLIGTARLLNPPADVALKNPADFRLVGKPHHRLDAQGKTDGSTRYGIDAMPEGLKFATLATCPVFGGTVDHVDTNQAETLPGVRQIVQLDDLVAVVGAHMWAAKQGLEALTISWNEGKHGGANSAAIWADLEAASKADGVVAEKKGDALGQLEGDGVLEASYELPFLAHAAMEPMNCTVHLTPDRCEIWVGTQVPTMAHRAVAAQTGLRLDQIKINNHLIGGGFGRRLEVDGIVQAVRIAKHVDGPVKVVWSREEDIQKSMYRPVYRSEMASRLVDGKPIAWRHKVIGSSVIARLLPPAFVAGLDPDAVDGAIEQPYSIPNRLVEYVRHEPEAVPTCFWRGVGPNNTIYAAECFMDLLARKAGSDPIAFRRELLRDNARALAVLDLAVLRSDWHAPLGPREGRGVCLEAAFGSFLATIAEVRVDDDGTVAVKRLTCAVDCGVVVNPDGVVAQMQGGMVFGLSAALHGRITVANGRVEQSNFHDYRVLRIDEMPAIGIHLVRSGEAPGGIGEPGAVTVQPAVANAVLAAVGIQPNRMPIDKTLLAKDRA